MYRDSVESINGSKSVIKESRVPKARLLIVDDESEFCMILKENIEEAGFGEFEVELAEDARQALDKVAAFEPDLVLVDIKMPHMWGDQMIEEIKKLETPQPKAYFIISAVYDEAVRHRLTAQGHLYFTKPFNMDELFQQITAKCFDLGLVKRAA